MKFRTIYTAREVVFSEVGDRIKPEYTLMLNDDGVEELQQTGYTDLKEEIQSHHDSVCLENILMRFQNGDDSALDKVQGFYADVSDMPVKLNDVINVAREGKRIFEGLPKDVRNVFGNDYMSFINNPELMQKYLDEKNNKKNNNEVADKKGSMEEVKNNDDKEQ